MRLATLLVTVVGLLAVAVPAQADNWKDESGQGRWRGPPPWAGGGETPGWARGKGYWDGHVKHNKKGFPGAYGGFPGGYGGFPNGRGGFPGGYGGFPGGRGGFPGGYGGPANGGYPGHGQLPAQDDGRRVWVYGSQGEGSFQQQPNGMWVESNTTGQYYFHEVARTPESIELYDSSRGASALLTERMMYHHGPGDPVWHQGYQGNWQ